MALMDNVGLSMRGSLPLVRDIINAQGLQDKDPDHCIRQTDYAGPRWPGRYVLEPRLSELGAGLHVRPGLHPNALQCDQTSCPTGITTHNRRLQRGLDPADKAVKVANYCLNLRHDVGVIAHSCGVPHPRRLRRFHVRLVCPDGRSRSMSELYPTDDPSDAGVVSPSYI